MNGKSLPRQMLEPIPVHQPKGYGQNWRIYVDGEEIFPRHLKLANSIQNLQVEWGNHPLGRWSQPALRELNGGGVVLIPFSIASDGTVYIGIIEVIRPFRDARDGHIVVELPRGFHNVKETKLQAASREAEEETGIKAPSREFFVLEGEGVNPNSSFWITFNNVTQEPDGITYVATRVPWESLVPNGNKSFKLGADVSVDIDEGIVRSIFVPFNIHELAVLGDMFVHTGLIRLQSYLIRNFYFSINEDGSVAVSAK